MRGYRVLVRCSLITCSVAASALGGWESIGSVAAQPPQGNQILFSGRGALAAVTVLAPDLVRIRVAPGAQFGPDYSWAVVKTGGPQVPVEFSGDKQTRVVRTPELEVRIQLAPFRVAFYDLKGNLISKDARDVAWDGDHVRAWKWMPPDEHYYGLGEKAGPVDKRGHAYVMWNTDPAGYDANSDPMYQSIPFFIAIREGKAYGIFFDNTYRSSFDMGAEGPDFYSFGASGGEMNYYFFYGPDPKKVLSRFTELVGRTPLPPRWSLGYIQSNVRYYPESTFRFVADSARYYHIPCDALFLDTMYMDDYRVFTWDKAGFPNPARMLSDLRRQGFRVIAITEAYVKVDERYWVYQQGLAGDHFLKRKDGRLYVGNTAGDCAFWDFTSEKTRAWWGSLFEGLLKDGIAGFLADVNEPSVVAPPEEWIPKPFDPDVIHWDHGLRSPDAKNHNIYGLLMTQAVQEGMLRFRPNERPFVVTRATYAGGQRYAAQWTGDNLATWEDLRASLRLGLGMGLSGLAFTGSDIGGFLYRPSPELYTRWMQAGVFHPYFMTHNADPERPLDPWSSGDPFREINRRSIELRYRLLPYLYNAFYQETQTGIPIVRALVLDYPDDPKVLDATPVHQYQYDEFLFGEDLLVAPVTRSGETTRRVYLPRGTWYDFWSGELFSGPVRITVKAPLDVIPIFVRGGAIVPMQQVVQYTDQAPINPLTFEIYPEGDSTRQYYEDDGISFAYRQGGFLLQRISVSQQEGQVRVRITPREGRYAPPDRSLVLKIHGQPCAPCEVRLAGKTMAMQTSPGALDHVPEGAVYHAVTQTVWMKTRDQGAALEVVVRK